MTNEQLAAEMIKDADGVMAFVRQAEVPLLEDIVGALLAEMKRLRALFEKICEHNMCSEALGEGCPVCIAHDGLYGEENREWTKNT